MYSINSVERKSVARNFHSYSFDASISHESQLRLKLTRFRSGARGRERNQLSLSVETRAKCSYHPSRDSASIPEVFKQRRNSGLAICAGDCNNLHRRTGIPVDKGGERSHHLSHFFNFYHWDLQTRDSFSLFISDESYRASA